MSEAERRTETIPQWTKQEVAELSDFLESYDAVGVVGMAGIPSRQLQSMRRDLYGSAEVRMSRNTLAVRALQDIDEGVEQLVEYVEGQVALIGTNDNPFGLYQQLEASKTSAPINDGEVAPNDIVIPEGDTGIDPGPFVGELQSVGASARIMEGSIKVTEDSHVLDAGETVSEDLANVLAEMGIEPKEVGLDLRAVYADGVLFEPEELALDVDEYREDIQAAAAAARNLSVNAAYPTAGNAGTLLAKAAGEAKSVGLEATIVNEELAPDLIGKADAQLRALAAQIDDEEALPEELQGVEAAPDPAPEADDAVEEEQAEEDDETDDVETTDDDADEDDGDDGGEGLGAMFG